MSEYYDDEENDNPDLYNLPQKGIDWSMYAPQGGGGGAPSGGTGDPGNPYKFSTTVNGQMPNDPTSGGMGYYGSPVRQPGDSGLNTGSSPISSSGGMSYSSPFVQTSGGSLGNPVRQPGSDPLSSSPLSSPLGGNNTNITNNTSNSSAVGLAPNNISMTPPSYTPGRFSPIDMPLQGGAKALPALPPSPASMPSAPAGISPPVKPGGVTSPRMAIDLGKPAPSRADTALGIASMFSPLARKAQAGRQLYKSASEKIAEDKAARAQKEKLRQQQMQQQQQQGVIDPSQTDWYGGG